MFDQRNRIISEGTKSYAWSARGTLDSITDGASTTSYAFDGLGRMTAVGGTSYSYDGLNRIINRDSTAFTYSGVHNQPTSDGTTVLSRTPDGSPLAIAEGATRLSLLADRHGDVVASMSAAGVLVDSVAFSPWGEPAARQGATALTVGYQSSYTDPTTGLIDMGARWYQASTGTFTNRDTYNGVLSSPISLNRYTYANNNPIDYFDPDGRMSADAAENYASKGYACSGTKRGPDCQRVKPKPIVTKTADRVQRERDQAVAEATAVERQEANGGPRIFVSVDPPRADSGPPQPGSGGPGTNGSGPGSTPGNEPFLGAPGRIRDAVEDSRLRYSRRCSNRGGACVDVDLYPEDEGWSPLGDLFHVGLIDMAGVGWCEAKHMRSGSAQDCEIDVLRDSRADIRGTDLNSIDTEVVDNILEWAGAKQADPCGVSPAGVTVYCVAVTRLPSMKPGTDAMTIGHFILYDVTEPGADYVVKPGAAFSLPVARPELFQHEFGGHIAQWEEFGSDFLWMFLKDPGSWECQADEASGVPGNGCP